MEMEYIPSTDSTAASISISDEQAKQIEQIDSSIFIQGAEIPKNIRIKISDDESLSEQGRQNVDGGILEID